MNLPKFVPGLTVLTEDNEIDTIVSGSCTDGRWEYTFTTVQPCFESLITHVYNNGFFIPAGHWESPRLAEFTAEMIEGQMMYDELTADDPEETDWLENQKLGLAGRTVKEINDEVEKAIKNTRKIEVTNG